ncbi:MAG: hypothetical protein LBM93_12165, partial [Oscillospiraceae bacterium]|nr:hypothetical protein [Oscillospiraceae bacterium]
TTHYEYGDTSDTQAYNAYNYLVNKNAVCQGITLAFDYVAERAGVECNFAFSDEMRHVWNVVKLEGKWYYIDLTWNDYSHIGVCEQGGFFSFGGEIFSNALCLVSELRNGK